MKKYKKDDVYNYFKLLTDSTKESDGKYYCLVENEHGEKLKVRTDQIIKQSKNEFKHKDFSGEQFGRLTLVNRISKSEYGTTRYSAKCTCGNETEIILSQIMKGVVSSCGCIVSELNTEKSEKMFVGKKFGRLTVKSIYKNNNGGNIVYRCLCDCGNYTNVSTSNLRSGSTKSCGCLLSEKSSAHAQKNIDKYFQKHAKKVNVENTNLDAIDTDNRKMKSTNTSGITGVSWSKDNKKWVARITLKGQVYHLGYFKDKQEAGKARKEAEEKYFKPILEKYKGA